MSNILRSRFSKRLNLTPAKSETTPIVSENKSHKLNLEISHAGMFPSEHCGVLTPLGCGLIITRLGGSSAESIVYTALDNVGLTQAAAWRTNPPLLHLKKRIAK